MYLIITLLLLLLPIAECRAQEVRELLNKRGYEQGNIRVWLDVNGSIQGCEDVGSLSTRVPRDFDPVYARLLFEELALEFRRQEINRRERESERNREIAVQRNVRRILRQAKEKENIRVQNAMVLGLGCFILMVSFQIMVLLSKEQGARMAGFC